MRKRYEDYRKEYVELSQKLNTLNSRIIERANTLIKKFPDIKIKVKYWHSTTTPKEYIKFVDINFIHNALEIIKLIEDHNSNNIIQGKLFNE